MYTNPTKGHKPNKYAPNAAYSSPAPLNCTTWNGLGNYRMFGLGHNAFISNVVLHGEGSLEGLLLRADIYPLTPGFPKPESCPDEGLLYLMLWDGYILDPGG